MWCTAFLVGLGKGSVELTLWSGLYCTFLPATIAHFAQSGEVGAGLIVTWRAYTSCGIVRVPTTRTHKAAAMPSASQAHDDRALVVCARAGSRHHGLLCNWQHPCVRRAYADEESKIDALAPSWRCARATRDRSWWVHHIQLLGRAHTLYSCSRVLGAAYPNPHCPFLNLGAMEGVMYGTLPSQPCGCTLSWEGTR